MQAAEAINSRGALPAGMPIPSCRGARDDGSVRRPQRAPEELPGGSSPSRIALVRIGAMGDTIVLFPLLAAIRRRHPASRVVAIGRTDVLELARRAGLCHRVLSPDAIGWWTLGAAGVRADPRLRRALGGVGLLYDLDRADLPESEGRSLGLPPRRRIPALPPAGETRSAARFYLDAAGFPEAPPWVGAPCEAVPAAGAPWIAIAPGAGSPRKRAPIAWFAEVARAARAAGMRVALVAGEADDAAVSEWRAREAPEDAAWRGLPLTALAERLAAASGFVSNDSGIAHLAAWTGLPGVVRFVASDARVWGPPSPRVLCVPPGSACTGAEVLRRLARARRL